MLMPGSSLVFSTSPGVTLFAVERKNVFAGKSLIRELFSTGVALINGKSSFPDPLVTLSSVDMCCSVLKLSK